MKKTKLTHNFFSAADKVFGLIAVLFTPRVAVPVCSRVPFFARR